MNTWIACFNEVWVVTTGRTLVNPILEDCPWLFAITCEITWPLFEFDCIAVIFAPETYKTSI